MASPEDPVAAAASEAKNGHHLDEDASSPSSSSASSDSEEPSSGAAPLKAPAPPSAAPAASGDGGKFRTDGEPAYKPTKARRQVSSSDSSDTSDGADDVVDDDDEDEDDDSQVKPRKFIPPPSDDDEDEPSEEEDSSRRRAKSSADSDEDDAGSVIRAKTSSSSSSSDTEDDGEVRAKEDSDDDLLDGDAKKVDSSKLEGITVLEDKPVHNGQANGIKAVNEPLTDETAISLGENGIASVAAPLPPPEPPFASFVSHQVPEAEDPVVQDSAFKGQFFQSDQEELSKEELELSKRITLQMAEGEPDVVKDEEDDDERPAVGPGGDIPVVSVQSDSSETEEEEDEPSKTDGDSSSEAAPIVVASSPESKPENIQDDVEKVPVLDASAVVCNAEADSALEELKDTILKKEAEEQRKALLELQRQSESETKEEGVVVTAQVAQVVSSPDDESEEDKKPGKADSESDDEELSAKKIVADSSDDSLDDEEPSFKEKRPASSSSESEPIFDKNGGDEIAVQRKPSISSDSDPEVPESPEPVEVRSTEPPKVPTETTSKELTKEPDQTKEALIKPAVPPTPVQVPPSPAKPASDVKQAVSQPAPKSTTSSIMSFFKSSTPAKEPPAPAKPQQKAAEPPVKPQQVVKPIPAQAKPQPPKETPPTKPQTVPAVATVKPQPAARASPPSRPKPPPTAMAAARAPMPRPGLSSSRSPSASPPRASTGPGVGYVRQTSNRMSAPEDKPRAMRTPSPSSVDRANLIKRYTQACEVSSRSSSSDRAGERRRPTKDITEIYTKSVAAASTPPASPRVQLRSGRPTKDITKLYTAHASTGEASQAAAAAEKLCPRKHNMTTNVDRDGIRMAYDDVRDDASDTEWAVFKFDGNKLGVTSSGMGFPKFKEFFGNDDRGFGYIRIKTGDEMSKRAKFILVTWVGPSVSVMKKAKMSTDKALIKDIIQNFSVELQLENLGEFSYEQFKLEVDKAAGARYGTGFRDL